MALQRAEGHPGEIDWDTLLSTRLQTEREAFGDQVRGEPIPVVNGVADLLPMFRDRYSAIKMRGSFLLRGETPPEGLNPFRISPLVDEIGTEVGLVGFDHTDNGESLVVEALGSDSRFGVFYKIVESGVQERVDLEEVEQFGRRGSWIDRNAFSSDDILFTLQLGKTHGFIPRPNLFAELLPKANT